MRLKISLLVRGLAALGGGMLAGRTTAQTFTVLHTFSGADGGRPLAGLIASGNTLYGTTTGAGITAGTVFRVNTDGSGFTNLYTFSGSDGRAPDGRLILLGDTLYGTTRGGGSFGASYGDGTVFAISTNGSSFATLYNFSGADGQGPVAGLTAGGDTLYGTTQFGGGQGDGTVFGINTDGSGFNTLYDFNGGYDGGAPYAGLALSSNTLYGATGGGAFPGTVFALNTDGTAFTVLDTFTNSETPDGTIILSQNTLYGTMYLGGASGWGSVFALAGNVFTTLHSFSSGSEGFPRAGVILSGDTLYGSTVGWDSGIVFALGIDGTQFTVLHSFTATNSAGLTNSDGLAPTGGLLLMDNTLYGTTAEGGSAGYGTIFSIALTVLHPQLTISAVGATVLLTWPTNAAGFTLQSSSNLSPVANWVDSTNTPSIIADHYLVTDLVANGARFYRLKQ